MSDCAILALASTTDTVHALLDRLVKDVVPGDHVPWTIVNKYYMAKVTFLVHTLSSWTAIQELQAPALVFVWNSGEPYRDHIRELSLHASLHEFEVSLAIRLGAALPAEVEDDQDIDAYLSSKGFEFVNVPDVEASSSDRSGIPGIHRIVDALSTIMWPSMVQQPSKRATTTGGVQRNPGDDYHTLVQLVGQKISGNDGDRLQRELQELERWLDEDTDADPGGDDDTVPWSTVVTPGTLSPSSSGFLETSRPTTPKPGFDDDFTSFVSASSPSIPRLSFEGLSSSQRCPPLASTSFGSTFNFNSASSTPTLDDHGYIDMTRLAPGESYKSLGSVSDFEDRDKDSIDLERLSGSSDESDKVMPSRLEIAETSCKIFGTMPLSLSPAQERGDTVADSVPSPGQEVDVEMMDADLERFDLQRVLGALQGLKEEIAGMPDEERRKAAARVALGLAYGLDSNSHSEASEELV